MKLYDLDWSLFVRQMRVWDRLALTTRNAFHNLKPNMGVDKSKFGDDLVLLRDAKFITLYTDGKRARLHKDFHPSSRAIRAMGRHEIAGSVNSRTLHAYLRDNFTDVEVQALGCNRESYGYGAEQSLVSNAMSIAWLEAFLAVNDAKTWERDRTPEYRSWGMKASSWKPLLGKSGTLRAAQEMIRVFMASPTPLTFHELPERFPEVKLPLLGTIIMAGIRYLLLFPYMRHDDMMPMLTLWPGITRRLHRPKVAPPVAVTPDETFCGAYLMEDMLSVVVQSTAEPLRLRGNDYQLFARSQKTLEAELMPLPDWAVKRAAPDPSQRLKTAISFVRHLALVRVAGTSGKDLRLEPTEQANDWLALSAKERLKGILSSLRSAEPSNAKTSVRPEFNAASDLIPGDEATLVYDIDDEDDYDDFGDHPGLRFLPEQIASYGRRIDDDDLATAVAGAYASTPIGAFMPVTEFIDYHRDQVNPFMKIQSDGESRTYDSRWGWRQPTDEELEQAWGGILACFFEHRLLSLGGATLGLHGKERAACFELTDVGRYLLGRVEDFDYGHDVEAQVVVQPNFDIVFLAPSPLAEATISRFAERTGKGIGTLFRITKKSILTAAGGGMTAQAVLEALANLATKGMPANVEREIKGWFDQCRNIIIEPTILIRCPDAQTARRVISAGGRKVTALSGTVIELADRKMQSTLVRKLKDLGVFVDPPSAAAVSKSAPRRRRRRW